MATPRAAYGAMLAGVDYVLMGAGIPREIPHLLDELAAHRRRSTSPSTSPARDRRHVHGRPRPARPRSATHLPAAAPADVPRHRLRARAGRLPRPRRRAPAPTASSSRARAPAGTTPRRAARLVLDETGAAGLRPARRRPTSPRSPPSACRSGSPGGYGTPGGAAPRRARPAPPASRSARSSRCARSPASTPSSASSCWSSCAPAPSTVRTDAARLADRLPVQGRRSSPARSRTPAVYDARPRLCDLGYLRTPYRAQERRVGYRCPAEPVDVYVRKGGDPRGHRGTRSACATRSSPTSASARHRTDGYVEKPLLTLGEELGGARHLLRRHPSGWTAGDALDWLLGPVPTADTADA